MLLLSRSNYEALFSSACYTPKHPELSPELGCHRSLLHPAETPTLRGPMDPEWQVMEGKKGRENVRTQAMGLPCGGDFRLLGRWAMHTFTHTLLSC